MFYYSKFGSNVIIKRNGGQNKCQRNDLTRFSGQNFTKIRIDGRTKYQQKFYKTEFVLKSCNSVIDKVEVYYCQINLDEAAGNFQHIVFKNCTFTGSLSDKFNAESLEFFCGIQLYSLSAGNVKEINITCVNKNVEIDFANANQMKNLNKLIFKSVPLNLSKLTGTWKYVLVANCDLNEQISKSFKPEYLQISIYDKNILINFIGFEFNHFRIALNRSYTELALLKQIQWQSINLTLYFGTIDLEQYQVIMTHSKLSIVCQQTVLLLSFHATI
ncbi:Hypothetical_protein [Hexamita inflata]|uniref:Hypothetical_protein n=1 Tax=Hexamita inflata TaxID=28002 RepID=A0AA86PEB4_9EUKA|nr:Hypothetical protein HINF_LOCUS22150 [Hexamita inflata]